MLVLNISLYDLAGVGYKLHEAINRYGGEWESRHIVLNTTFAKFPIDILVVDKNHTKKAKVDNHKINEVITMENKKKLRRLIRKADVIQFNHTWRIDSLLGYNVTKGKVKAVYHTGSAYRNFPRRWNKRLKDMDVTFITDETTMREICPWGITLRRCIDTEAFKPIKREKSNKIIIAHSPSHERRKGTKYLRDAIKKLKKEFPNVEMRLIKGVTNKEAIDMKKDCDIFYDQIYNDPKAGSVGISGLEAACFGIPIVVRKTTCPSLPFINVEPETLYYELRNLIKYRKYRKVMGRVAREYVVESHSYKAIAETLIKQYNKIIKKRKRKNG
jgi:glycosyltransferase involved in cell wall biosynthesis